jgi:hypothetical protein
MAVHLGGTKNRMAAIAAKSYSVGVLSLAMTANVLLLMIGRGSFQSTQRQCVAKGETDQGPLIYRGLLQ